MKSDTIFIAWNQISRRSEEFSKQILAEYINLGRVEGSLITRSIRLISNFIKSYFLFLEKKPNIIITFHAHPFITLVAIIYKQFFNCKVIADLHSAAYLDYYQFPLKFINRWIWERTDILLIHNKMAFTLFNQKIPGFSKKLFILEDPIPERSNIPKNNVNNSDSLNGVLINRFSKDEPIDIFLRKIKDLEGVNIFITGDFTKTEISQEKLKGPNYELTGFLSDDDYWELLSNANFIIALTTREYTLLSAGYEAIALEKPLIISGTNTLKNYFNDNVIYFDIFNDDIQILVNKVRADIDSLNKKMKKLKISKTEDWNLKVSMLQKKIDVMS